MAEQTVVHIGENSPEEVASRLMRDTLIKRGRPLACGQLFEALKEDGVFVGGQDPIKILGTIIWRLRNRFTNIEGHGYWPRDVACPAVGFEPEI